ncbi:unnamed protein product [Moneuplotes crassus]|uniref:Uncharacterized protein n=1 Tax=Euplotes crassus TaxID=5936 RepID=A0AAD1U5H3_EUPCR|nr:unnamed protein product [Moneuplotes crassus]
MFSLIGGIMDSLLSSCRSTLFIAFTMNSMSQANSTSSMSYSMMSKEEKMRFLLTKFAMPRRALVPSQDWQHFGDLIKLNAQLKKPLEICNETWYFMNDKIKDTWSKMIPEHTYTCMVLYSESDKFLEFARSMGKVDDSEPNSCYCNIPGTHFKPELERCKYSKEGSANSEMPNYFGSKKKAKKDPFAKKPELNYPDPLQSIENQIHSPKKVMLRFNDEFSSPKSHTQAATPPIPLAPSKTSKSTKPSLASSASNPMIIDSDSENDQTQISPAPTPYKSPSTTPTPPFSTSTPTHTSTPAALHTAYPINVNLNPPLDSIPKRADTTLHQDMLRMSKRFDFFMTKFSKLEDDLTVMKESFQKVVEFATQTLSRREKQNLLKELEQTGKTKVVKENPDDDEYDRVLKKEEEKEQKRQEVYNTNIYTAEIDPSQRIHTLGEVKRQTQQSINTQLMENTEKIDVPEVMRKTTGVSGERNIKAKDLKEVRKRESLTQGVSAPQDLAASQDPFQRAARPGEEVLGIEDMLTMIHNEDLKDKKEEEKAKKKRGRKPKNATQTEKAPKTNTQVEKELEENLAMQSQQSFGITAEDIRNELKEDFADEDCRMGLFDEDQEMSAEDPDEVQPNES